MKELKNAWHTELAIGILINDEVELESISRSHGLSKFSDFYGEE